MASYSYVFLCCEYTMWAFIIILTVAWVAYQIGFKGALDRGETQSDYYVRIGQQQFKTGNYEGAITEFTRAITLDGRNWMAFNNRGNTNSILADGVKNDEARLELLSAAIVDFERSISINPDRLQNSKAYSNMARDLDAIHSLQEGVEASSSHGTEDLYQDARPHTSRVQEPRPISTQINTEIAGAKLEELHLKAAADASAAAENGATEHAKQLFIGLILDSSNAQIISLASTFFAQTDDLASMSDVFDKERRAVLSGAQMTPSRTAAAYDKLGDIYATQSDYYDRAELMYEKALELNEAVSCREGVAFQCDKLGRLYQFGGELDAAKDMYVRALKACGAVGCKEGMAIQYGCLGKLYLTNGDLEMAEEMFKKALSINKALGSQERRALNLSCLGLLYVARDDYDQAKSFFEEALDLQKALGCKEEMATDYSNLGFVYQSLGDFDQAKYLYEMALDLNKTLGRKESMAIQYGCLGALYIAQGELDRVEDMLDMSLELDASSDRKNGAAIQYFNLGDLYKTRGNMSKAGDLYFKSTELLDSSDAA